MTAKKQDRSNAYYKRRLQVEHRLIYDDFVAGKHKTLASALVEAGLKKPRSTLQALKSDWSKASAKEQRDFDVWRKRLGAPVTIAAPPSSSPRRRAFDTGNRLLPWATKRIENLIARRHMKMGDLMNELGLDKLNPSIGLALQRGYRIKDAEVADKLEQWLADNRGK